MRLSVRFLPKLTLVALAFMISSSNTVLHKASAQQGGAQLSAEGQRQINALLKEKYSRTPEQKKIDSQLLYAMKAQRGESITPGGEVRTLRSISDMVKTDAGGRVLVDIKAKAGRQLLAYIEKLGGEIIYASEKTGSIRALLPLDALEEVASDAAVRNVRAADTAVTNRYRAPFRINGKRPNFEQRAMNVRSRLSSTLSSALAKYGSPAAGQDPVTNVGSVTSQGVAAHRVTEASNFFGVTGAGVKIGVLSDSVNSLEQSIASGDLPPDVTVLPGQGGAGSGEGTAILEIIHDLAPGAKLFFATAFTSIDSFADNIRALRAAGCDIIVDDIIYFVESPFHDDTVSTAVEEVVADGALYFSSAGNEGNLNDGTSGTWEGDFKDSNVTLPSLPGGKLHDFGSGVISNFIVGSGQTMTLHWSDPLGASDNDYDLFVMDRALTTVVAASTTVQDGDDDPYERTIPPGGYRVLIFKADGAQTRALHLNNFRGYLGVTTPGTIRGHAAAAGGFAVAAIDVAMAQGGSFTGGPTNFVEYFSADGPRRVFYKSDGTPFTPGNILFSSGGGEVRRKPDLTAADGVMTSVPGFSPFFGTSAAAPHAAAVAALLKSASPRATQNRIRQALTRTALDIEADGIDRDSGAGIVDAYGALDFIGAAPSPFLAVGPATATAVGGDGDNFIEPGENGALTVPLNNIGGATAIGISATLTTSTSGVIITSASSGYPAIGSNGQSANNTVPFAFTVAPTVACGMGIDFSLTVNYANSNEGPQVLTFSFQVGEPATTIASFNGPPVPIPDNAVGTVTIPIEVSGLSGPIDDLNFRIDGSSCTSDIGSTTVGLDHTWVGDLIITLTSPQGTTVTLMSQAGGSGNNFCNTVLDDSATALIQNILPTGAPWTGTFKPANPLAAFNGEGGNGTWTLSVTDIFAADGGNVRAFSLAFGTFVCSGP
jgi:subtilisin-like proprotein convertase family protein